MSQNFSSSYHLEHCQTVIEKSEDTLNVTPELCLKIRSGTNIDPVLIAIGHLPLNCYFCMAPLIVISYK